MKRQSTYQLLMRKSQISLIIGIMLFLSNSSAFAQLGTYTFTGSGNCPNQDPSVNSQPLNAIFSDFTNVGNDCDDADNVFRYKKWNQNNTIDLSQYNQFSITPAVGYTLTLNSLSFKQYADDDPGSGTTSWVLRSSLDNYASDIATGNVSTSSQTSVASLSPTDFTNVGAVTFRIYILNIKGNGTRWTMDNVSLDGTVNGIIATVLPADPANPTSNSPKCVSTGVTMNFNGTPPSGETWYWETSISDTSTANSSATATITTPGTYTYYVRSRNNTSLDWSNGAGSITVTVTADVNTPVFTLGASSSRCSGSSTVIYTATAANATGIAYSLDVASIAGNNTIDPSTGAVTYDAAWNGTTTIIATATGCNGPLTATHIVSIGGTIGTPVFAMGSTSARCQGATTITYAATANNTSNIIYSLNAASIAGNNSIDPSTGALTYDAAWNGNTTITATATGCNGPTTATHVVSIGGTIGTPVFAMGPTSARCQGAGTVNYSASATNNSGITYDLDAASLAGNNSINTATGAVSYDAAWNGTTTITATATGCNGPTTSVHTVTINPSVSAPVFALGSSSSKCMGPGTIIYTATAANATGITYSLDALSALTNSINASTGAVTYSALWLGSSTITAHANGCNGPLTSTHVVTVGGSIGTPVFALGASSARCQGAETITYTATANNTSNITYSLDAASIAGNNIINPATGEVTYDAGWSGNSTITATATGCNGPKTKNHVVSTSSPVSTPVFTLGATSIRCQGPGSITYTATALNNTGISYSLDAASIAGGNNINSSTGKLTYAPAWAGTTTITVTATGCGGPVTATHTVSITSVAATPVFALGINSSRCLGAGTVTYTATSTNSTNITYSLNGGSVAAGNTINPATGEVTYVAGWTGISVITANATGCNGVVTASHSATTTPSVVNPVFNLGATSTRCQAAGIVTYTASASNNTGITYSLDAASIAGNNSINTATGAVTYNSGWSGTSTITATANGCNGPTVAIHTVTINPAISTPVFSLGATSTRCQGAGSVTYTATSTNSTAITYSLNAASITGGNTINAATGIVTFAAGWFGNSVITATATGCGGPVTATHTVTTTATVGAASFALGATSGRCQEGNTITYTVNAAHNAGFSYNIDAASIAGNNAINPTTGALTFDANWSGITIITVTANGCNGPTTATHSVTTTSSVVTPVFTAGATSTRCQGYEVITYPATSVNNTGISYTLDAASIAGGNTIDIASGDVTYAVNWHGTSIITATASGCNGPVTATHTVTTTATVGTPVFSGGTTSTRCQGAGTVNYPATATAATSITFSLDAASIAGGNTINGATGAVSFAAAWSGTTIIKASAAGCSGPATSNFTVTVTPAVSSPVFLAGLESVRTQSAGAVTYTAVSSSATGMTYSLDVASIAGGNSINTTTGKVTWVAGWNGTSLITAVATGCNSTATSNHIVTTNASIVQAPLYLSTGQTLDRIDPVATGITTTIQTAVLSSTGTTNVSFTQAQPLCSDLIIKAQTLSVSVYVSIASGTMPANPSLTALIKYGSTNIISFNNPIYNSATGLLTWTGVLAADATVPAGQSITLQITTAQAGVTFKIDYHSMTKPSRISLLPVSTFINIISFNVYNAPYPGGSVIISANGNTNVYARAVVTNPFGYKDITGLDISIIYPLSTGVTTCVDSSTCSRTYQFPWTTPSVSATYNLQATARQGFENNITQANTIPFMVCASCPPVAVTDSATGNGGSPLTADVLTNDYDPNNDLNKNSLAILVQPNNGTGYISNGKVVYLPNGSFQGKDTLTYQICDSSGLCANAKVYFTINPLLVDPCAEATKSHVFYLPFSENEARIALDSSTNSAFPSNNIRTVISMKMPYPGMVIVWDQWEDGYEANVLNPTQTTTQVWGDGNPYNGIAPGYSDDIIPAGGSIVLDNTIPTNPRVQANFFYDGKDKITSSGQITVTQVCGEPSIMAVQCMKTNVSATSDYGTLFTIPAGQDFPSQDFKYTSLFIRAAQDNTTINIDKDNNGTLETTAVINEGQVYHVNGGVLSGATVTASAPIGVELHFGGHDSYSSRDIPIFPASWYYSTYYSPVPTTRATQNPADTAVVMLYNNLNRPITINWSSGIPSSGSVTLPAKKVVRFPLAVSTSAAYKFVNPTGESFTAIQICDSYTPGGGGNSGQEYDWSFNLIAQNRLTDFATIAWAPGSTDGTRNDNPVWVTPTNNTTIYVKYDGKISGNTGLLSPCGMRYDVSYSLNALKHKRLLDPSDKDQSGLAVFTCDGTALAAVYGEDPSTAVAGSPSWDVGSTIQPFCKQKLIFANDDYARTLISQPVTIPILLNDFGFLAVIDPASVSTTALLQPKHGTVTINPNGTVIYTPNTGFAGKDTFEYSVCSTPTPVVCDNALVYIDISVCPAPLNANVISGQAYYDKNKDGLNNDGATGVAGIKVYLYADGNCNNAIDANELKDSTVVDASGTYQFVTYPEKIVSDDFDAADGSGTCNIGTDGNSAWASNWVDAGDGSIGLCTGVAGADAEVAKDLGFTNAIRLKDNNVSVTRTVNLSGATYAFLSFSYRRKSATLTTGKNVIVQASTNGTTFGTVFTIAGDGTADADYVTIYNQDISAYASATTYIRFLTNNNVGNTDTVYIDDVKVQYLKYPQCYITKMDASTVPVNYYTTTPIVKNFTAVSNTTCLAPYDFGIAKTTVSISGTLYDDPNALLDNVINGTAIGTVSTLGMNVFLADTTGKVLFKTIVNPANGTYSFPSVDIQGNYKLGISTQSVTVGSQAPADITLPANWVTTGDAYGLNNLSGSGNKSGTPTGALSVTTGTLSVSGVNFGIERLPNSDDKSVQYSANLPGQQYAVPALTGSDPEDGVLGTGKTYKITSLPNNAVLFYNGIAVTLNKVLTSFNPALFKIDPANGVIISTFTYAAMDAAGLYDPTPATVEVKWITLLPVTLLDFNGQLNGTKVDLFWRTSSEQNSDHFDVEHSTDGQEFKAFAQVKAKGTSNTETKYAAVDPMPAKGMNYYRLKMLDKDATFTYSNIVPIRVNSDATLTTRVMPNPFTGKLDIYLTLPHSCMVAFNFVDVSGKVVYSKRVKGLKGFNWFVVNDLEKLPTAPYILNVITDEQTFTEKLIKQ